MGINRISVLTKDGTGTLSISGLSGTTSIFVNGGTLRNIAFRGTVALADVAGVTLDLNGRNAQISSLAGGGASGGNVTMGTATLTVVGTSSDVQPFAGVISGAGALTIRGTGRLILTGANTYTGATTISAGILQLGNGGTAGSIATSSALSIASGGTLVFNRSNAVAQGTDFASVISSAGALTQNGPGTLTLSGANTYTGRTTVNGGTLVLAFGTVSSNIIDSSSPLTLGGGTLQLTDTGTQTFGDLTTTASTGSRIVLGNDQTLTLGTLTAAGSASALNFNTAAGGANGATLGTGLILLTGQTADNVIHAGFTVTDSGGFGLATVNGFDQVVRKIDTLLLPASGAVSTTDYQIDNNTGGTAAAGSSSLDITASQAVRSLTVDTSAGNGAVTLALGAVLSADIWNFGGTGSNTWQISGSAGGAGLQAVASGNAIEINNYASGTVTLSAPILDNTGTSVNFKGTGTTVLAGVNTYTGSTSIRGGTLEVVAGGSITHTTADMVVGKSSGDNGTLKLMGGAISNNFATLGLDAGSFGTATVSSGTWTISSNLTVGNNGTGVLNLSGTGAISSSALGSILGQNAGSLGTANVSGGTWTTSNLRVGGSGTGVLNLSGTGAISNGIHAVLGFSAGSIGTANVSGGTWTSSNHSLTVGSSGTGVLNLSGSGAVSNTSGTLGNSAGSSGTANVSGGTWTSSGDLTVGSSGTGVLNLTGGTVHSGGVAGTGTVALGNAGDGSGTLNLGTGGAVGTLNAATVTGGAGTAVVNFNHTGSYSFDRALTGALSVNKLGSGTTTLSGTGNTYSGTTVVDSGAIVVNGSITGTAGVTVAASATLAGTGAITTALNQSVLINGSLSVGDPGVAAVPSTLAVTTSGTGGIVMSAGSFIRLDLFTGAGTAALGTSDTLSLAGVLNATAGGTLVIGNPNAMTGFVTGDRWQVVNLNAGTGSVTGTLAVDATALGSGVAGSFDPATGILSIIVSATGPTAAQQTVASSGLPMASAQGQMLLGAGQTVTNDVNNHLFNLIAGDGEEAAQNSLTAALDEGVIVGQGDGPEDPIARKVKRSRQWEVFTTVNYGNVKLSAVGTQAGVQVDSWAPGVGIQRHLSPGIALGFAVSFLTSEQGYTGGLGSLHMEGPALSAYLTFVRKNFWNSLLYSFGSYELDSTRNPGGAFPLAFGTTRTYTNAVQYNAGWNFRFQDNTFVTGPFIGIDYLHGSVNAYSETGGGAAALRYAQQSFESLVTRVGWAASKKLKTSWAAITPQVRLSYERQNLQNNGTSVSLINAPFSATGGNQSPGQDYMVLGTGVNFDFNEQLSLNLNYQVQFFRQDMQAHFGSVRIGYKF